MFNLDHGHYGIVSLFSDSGARMSEIAGGRREETEGIQVESVDMERHRIKVMGKGGRRAGEYSVNIQPPCFGNKWENVPMGSCLT